MGTSGTAGTSGTTADVTGAGAGRSGAAGSPGAPGSPSTPGQRVVPADRDSSPFSTEVVASFRNGRVDAGQGLDVRTVRPRLTLLTRVTAAPRNPVLEITFAKSGRATDVRLLRSSGYRVEVDEPVLAAAYNWRAGGLLIDRLPEHPAASVKMTITIILN